MRLNSFTIKNFKSISDSGWITLSADNVTVFIGQNEAGKSALLEALEAFEENEIDSSQTRASTTDDVGIRVCYEADEAELRSIIGDRNIDAKSLKRLKELGFRVTLARTWSSTDAGEGSDVFLEDDELSALLDDAKSKATVAPGLASVVAQNEGIDISGSESASYLDSSEFAREIFLHAPQVVLFKEEYGRLPNSVDISAIMSTSSEEVGVEAARDFLAIAGLDDVEELVGLEDRFRDTRLKRACKKVTSEFQEFWTQVIGGEASLAIDCDIKNYSSNSGEKSGKPYLVFWLVDEMEHKLNPSQRSKGVQWFLSFFIQMTASFNSEGSSFVYLLDEPGGSLHAKAQQDVLKLIEKIKESVPIIYTTHSPYLLDHEKIHRVKAVQRKDSGSEQSPTDVISALSLSAASRETLSPLYAAMGIDFSHQNVIKRDKNVVLEEISARYYLKAFFHLAGKSSRDISFIPAVGVNNVPAIANMLLGWGIEFGVLLDADSSGRRVFNNLKRTIFLDDDVKSRKKMTKVAGEGIEDTFTHTDFQSIVLDSVVKKRSKGESNSAYIRRIGLSKVIVANSFLEKVEAKKVRISDLQAETVKRIESLVSEVEKIVGINV